jgi:radical SAM superfamily enzyme YgiQ (UPF0313 family)
MNKSHIKEEPMQATHHVYMTAPRPQIKDLDALPLVDRSLVDYEKYSRHPGLAFIKNKIGLFTSRGCPYKCAYCHKLWPKNHVFRSAENVFSEVQLYYDMGINSFALVDDIFNLNKKNSEKFFRLIIKNKLNVRFFFPSGVRGDILTRDYIDLMVEAGTLMVAFALETASPRLQKLIGKNLNLGKFTENIEYVCKNYPQVGLDLFMMLGFPTETEEEAMMTLNFLKRLKWVHYPNLSLLKIYPNTDMEKLALENGVSKESIMKSDNLAYYEIPETLPFSKSFLFSYQTAYLHEYFLLKERLLHVLPFQMKILTEDEFIQKYNSFLPTEINSLGDFLQLAEITKEELKWDTFLPAETSLVPEINAKIKAAFPAVTPDKDALKILLIDLSQFFTGTRTSLYEVVEPPLGMMTLLSFLNHHMGTRINGKIIKSKIDFEDYEQLKELLDEFNPEIIGLRTLTYFKTLFHETAAFIREIGIKAPIIAGGPYATSEFREILQDTNIDLVVIGEGEITLSQLIQKFLENGKKLPPVEILKEIPGICFIPDTQNTEKNKVQAPDVFSHFNEDLENE